MPQRKKESAASVTARSKRFRARRREQQRVKQDFIFRDYLQRFYRQRNIDVSAFVLLDEFYSQALNPLIERKAFIDGLRHLRFAIDTATVFINGEYVQVVKPQYILSEKT